ncbi:MAG TPA: DUF2945 domain-containing protein [Nitrococcus sp.]|nr:DUF2945 domain-containing protein [Nitrococcus sp.]
MAAILWREKPGSASSALLDPRTLCRSTPLHFQTSGSNPIGLPYAHEFIFPIIVMLGDGASSRTMGIRSGYKRAGSPASRCSRGRDKMTLSGLLIMVAKFKVGDHVTWNSEAGQVSGTIIKVHTKDFDYKGHTHRASADDPQYEIKSDKTDHIAAHKGSALKKISR